METGIVASEVDAGRGSRWLLPGILLLYLAVAFGQSAIKLLWADELITYYVAQQPGWSGIWRALAAGADPNPPLIHVLVQASTAAFGAHAWAIRLPGILCVLLAIVSMWSVLRRWVAPPFATAGVLAFMCTRGFDYSYDARSYAPLMAFAMAAFALWVRLPDGRRRLQLVGLAAALGLGISSNYYGVLAFFPIAAGELVRTRESRKVDWGVWVAMSAGALPLLAYLSLIRHNIAEFAPHAWNRAKVSVVALSYLELVEGVFWLVLLVGAFAIWKRRGAWPVARSETVAMVILLLYPLIGFLIAIGGAGMISPRCVVPVCCGFGLAAGVLARQVFGSSRRLAFGFVAFLTLWFVVRESVCAAILLEQRRTFFIVRDQVQSETHSEPILISDSSLALPLHFYSDRDVRRMMFYPIDFDAIHASEADDSGEQNLWAGGSAVFNLRICGIAQLPSPRSPFLLLSRPDGWLAQLLRARGVGIRMIPDRQPGQWYGMGGVFSPMVHPETRLLRAIPKE